MTSHQDRVALEERLRQVLGVDPAGTLIAMLPAQEDLATKTDLALSVSELRTDMAELRTELHTDMAELRSELRTDMAELHSELRSIRQEMDLKYATKDDLMEMKMSFDANFHSYVRSFIATQAGTLVAMTVVFYALVRLT